jgi:hypothetical protein
MIPRGAHGEWIAQGTQAFGGFLKLNWPFIFARTAVRAIILIAFNLLSSIISTHGLFTSIHQLASAVVAALAGVGPAR